MGIKLRYKTYLIDGTKVNQQFSNNNSYLVGRNRLKCIYDILSMNVT